ncbi:hypothetical protein Pmani_000656 [Petrolisthes manimaculis]|uniref:DALR anticodon binding domain-containing protein n=1 Tax=Petrolisthes manimaculis TaxID=1843537 RepID=A0AAE1QMC9_9EUCA|nr:hypothetical protein Pmani_000656 [Petrolisthes manimaculis]
MHEFFLKTFAKSFLECVVGKDVTQDLIAVFTTVVRRVDFEHVSEGDILVPLQSLPLREMTPLNTPLACLLEEPSDHNLQAAQEAVTKCEIPISRLELSGGKAHKDGGKKKAVGEFLRVYLSRSEIMQRTFSKLVQAGVDYGSTTIMDQINLSISCDGLGEDVVMEEQMETSSEGGKTSQVRSCMAENVRRHKKKSVATLRILALSTHLLRLVRFHKGRVCLQAEVEEKVEEMRKRAEELKRKEEEDKRAKEEKQRKFKQWHQRVEEKETNEEKRRVNERKRMMTRRINKAFAKWKNEDWEDVEVEEVMEGAYLEGEEKVEWEGKDAKELMKERKSRKRKRKYAVPRSRPYHPLHLSTRQPTHKDNLDSSICRASSIPLSLVSVASKQGHSSKTQNMKVTESQDNQDWNIPKKSNSQSDSHVIGNASFSKFQDSKTPEVSNSDDFGTHQMWPEPTIPHSYKPGDAPWVLQSETAAGRVESNSFYVQQSEKMKSGINCILAGQSLMEYLGTKKRKEKKKQEDGKNPSERYTETNKKASLTGRNKQNITKRLGEQKLGMKRKKTYRTMSKLDKEELNKRRVDVKHKKKITKYNVPQTEMKKKKDGLGSSDIAQWTPDHDFQLQMKTREPDIVGENTNKVQFNVDRTAVGLAQKTDPKREELLADSKMHDHLSVVETESVSKKRNALNTVSDSHDKGEKCEGGNEWQTVSSSCVTGGDWVMWEKEVDCEEGGADTHVTSEDLVSRGCTKGGLLSRDGETESGFVRDESAFLKTINEDIKTSNSEQRGNIKKNSVIKHERTVKKGELMKKTHQGKEKMNKECESPEHTASEKIICLKIVSETGQGKESNENGERKCNENGECIVERECRCAGVVDKRTNKPWEANSDDFHSLVLKEVQRASEGRLGEDEEEEAWRRFLEQQVSTCVTLQLLSVSHQAQVKVDLGNHTHNSKEWAFVLYNYSRLCGIFESFDYFVAQGDLPPLPPPHQIDFSLLRHDEEWALVWAYIMKWPEVAESMGLGLLQWVTRGGKVPKAASFKTGVIVRFLSRLAHSTSRYYARHQVLPSDPSLAHLHPLVHVRLHLLHAIHTIMRTALGLLGVDSPPTSM